MSVKETSWHFNNVEGIAYKYTIDDCMGIIICNMKSMNPFERIPNEKDFFLEYSLDKKIESHHQLLYNCLRFKVYKNEVATGVAKCHDKHKFDEEIGKKIAYYRAYNKFMTRRKKKLGECITELINMKKDVEDLYNMLRCKLARNEVRLEECTK